jgi:membrane dipeptidase
MRFFDAHCDTVMRALHSGLDFVRGGPGHSDLPRLRAAGACAQLFAVFVVEANLPGRDLRSYADYVISVILGWLALAGGTMRLALTAEDLRAVGQDDTVYALLGLEGADPLTGDAENLAHYFYLGVRSVTPAWDDNAFAGTPFGANGGLTAEGFKLVEVAEALKVMVDVSHLSDAAFWQVTEVAQRPLIASHSNCRALCPSPRNLSDDMLRTVAQRGGVIGINLAPDYLEPSYQAAWDAIAYPTRAVMNEEDDLEAREHLRHRAIQRLSDLPRPGIDWVVRHIRHAMQVGGEDCVGLGGDLDGIWFLPEGMTGIESYPRLADALRQAGLTPRQVEKVCWRNMARVFTDVLP